MPSAIDDASAHTRPIRQSWLRPPLRLKAEGFSGIAMLSGAFVSCWFLPSIPLKIVFTILFLMGLRGVQILAQYDRQFFAVFFRHQLRYKRGYSPLPHIDAVRRAPREHQKSSAI